MSMKWLSIYLDVFEFLSPIFLGFRVQVLHLKIISKYFILVHDIIHRIVFLISFSVYSLLVYRNRVDFCVFILYPANLLNLFTSSNSVLVYSLGFCLHKIILSSDREFYFFPFLIPFYLFFFSNCPG